jgi:hypothetical protein
MSLGRVLLVSLAVLAVGFGLWRYWWTALDHHPEQDSCSFGPVTNAEYRALLAEARRRQAIGSSHWAPLHGRTRSVEGPPPGSPEQLAARMNELSDDTSSLYMRRAVMHAVMRGAGAYLHSARLSGRNDFSRDLAANRIPRSFISADYVLHSNYRGDGASLLAPFAWFPVTLNGEWEPLQPNQFTIQDLEKFKLANRFTVVGLDYSFLFHWPGLAGAVIFRLPAAEFCLPELNPRVAQVYEDWARSRPQPK